MDSGFRRTLHIKVIFEGFFHKSDLSWPTARNPLKSSAAPGGHQTLSTKHPQEHQASSILAMSVQGKGTFIKGAHIDEPQLQYRVKKTYGEQGGQKYTMQGWWVVDSQAATLYNN